MNEWASPDANPVSARSASSVPDGGSVPTWAQPAPPVGETRKTVVPLRPLTTGEILDGSITTIRRCPRAMFTLGAIGAVTVGGTRLVGLLLDSHENGIRVNNEDGSTSTFHVSSLALNLISSTFLSVIFTCLAAGVLRQALLGRPATPKDLFVVPIKRLLWVASLTTLVITVLFITVVGGLIAYVVLVFVGPVLALEGGRGRAALKRSRTLVKGSWWRTAGILLLVRVISSVIGAMLAIPAVVAVGAGNVFGTSGSNLSTGGQLAFAASGAAAALLITPFTACATVLIYADRRMRTEGLDVSLQQTVTETAA